MANNETPSKAYFGYRIPQMPCGIKVFEPKDEEDKKTLIHFKYHDIFNKEQVLSEKKIGKNFLLYETNECSYICFEKRKVDIPVCFAVIEKKPTVGETISVTGLIDEHISISTGLFMRTIIPEKVNTKFKKYKLYVIETQCGIYLCTLG